MSDSVPPVAPPVPPPSPPVPPPPPAPPPFSDVLHGVLLPLAEDIATVLANRAGSHKFLDVVRDVLTKLSGVQSVMVEKVAHDAVKAVVTQAGSVYHTVMSHGKVTVTKK